MLSSCIVNDEQEMILATVPIQLITWNPRWDPIVRIQGHLKLQSHLRGYDFLIWEFSLVSISGLRVDAKCEI